MSTDDQKSYEIVIDVSLYTIKANVIDNLASEFYGGVLFSESAGYSAGTAEKEEITVVFKDASYVDGFRRSLSAFLKVS